MKAASVQLQFLEAEVQSLPSRDAPGVHCWRDDSGAVIAYGGRDQGAHWMRWPALGTFRFSAHEPAVTAVLEPGASRAAAASVFTSSVLPMALQALGQEAVHASAVLDRRQGVVMFAGRSDAGKSTLACALSQRGLQQWADDGVAFRVDRGIPRAVPLTFKPRLRAASLRLLQDRPITTRRESRVPEPTAIAALCLLERTSAALADGRAVTLTRLRPADAFPSVLSHAYEFDPFDAARRAAMLEAYLDLVAHTPVFRLRFRVGAEWLDRVLDAVIRELRLDASGADRCQPL